MTDSKSSKVTKTTAPVIHTVNIPFTQDELKLVMAHINQSIKSGGLQIGDIHAIYPVIVKLQQNIVVEEAPKEPVFPVSKSN